MHGKEEVVEVSSGSAEINGRYERFNTRLGEGAFKRVYKAFDTVEQIDVAWNIIDLSSLHVDSERQRIFKECEILRKLKHPNILRIADQWYNQQDDHLNFITNIVHDGSLSKFFRNRRINVRRIKRIAKQILSALSYLHEQHIIHRDLKGDNIFIEGNTGNIVIGDMGLSCSIMSARSIVGTPHFMAPELFTERYDEMVDIWSFGMVILELVTQQIPYAECKGAYQAYQKIVGGTKPNILQQVSNPYIRTFIDICLNLNPRLRPSAHELLNHPFFGERAFDVKPCNAYIKPREQQYPEPTEAHIANQLQLTQAAQSKAETQTNKEQASKPTVNQSPVPTQENNPNSNATTTKKTERSKSKTPTTNVAEEKVVIENVEILDEQTTKLTMKIFSNCFADKVMTVAFEYDALKDNPHDVATEMVDALQLQAHFGDMIEQRLTEASQRRAPQTQNDAQSITIENTRRRQSEPAIVNTDRELAEQKVRETETESQPTPQIIALADNEKKEETIDRDVAKQPAMSDKTDESDQTIDELKSAPILNPTETEPLTTTTLDTSPASMRRMLSKESMRKKLQKETEEWLSENGLNELIAVCSEHQLTIEHFQAIPIDGVRETVHSMCQQMGWSVFTELKLLKAVQDLNATDSSSKYDLVLQEQMAEEQASILQALNTKHDAVSSDIGQIKDALNDLSKSANECSHAVRQNAEQLISLIEQGRDKLLSQIDTFRSERKKQLRTVLDTLHTINTDIVSTQQQCAKIVIEKDRTANSRLQDIKQLMEKLRNIELQHVFNNNVINKGDFKLELRTDLQAFVQTLASTMKLKFSEEVFELFYNNANAVEQEHVQTETSDNTAVAGDHEEKKVVTNDDCNETKPVATNANSVALPISTLNPVTSDTTLTNSQGTVAKIMDDSNNIIATIGTTVNLYDDNKNNKKDEKQPQTEQAKMVIDDIKLDFNQNDFILLSSLARSQTETHLQSKIKTKDKQNKTNRPLPPKRTSSNLDIQHNVNPLNKLNSPQSNHRRGHTQSVAGLMQSDFQHHHASPQLPTTRALLPSAVDHSAYAQTIHVLQQKPPQHDDNDSHHSYVLNKSPLDSPDNLHLLQQPEYVKSPTPRSINSFTATNIVSNNNTSNLNHYDEHMPVTPSYHMMKRRNTVINLSERDRDQLLVDGYIHQNYKQTHISHELHACLYRFYHFECELLKFSKIYKSGDGWRFYNGNTCIKRMKAATCLNNHSESDESSSDDDDDSQLIKYKWILADIAPKMHGVYCWRINVRNPNKGNIVIGVCPQRMFKSDAEHNEFVYGIGIFGEHQTWYPLQHLHRNQCELHITNKSTQHQCCQIDMKLNCIKGEVSFCVVEDDHDFELGGNIQEAVIQQLPAIDTVNYSNGWVPYVKSYNGSVGSQIKMAICPRTWYSRYRDAIFE